MTGTAKRVLTAIGLAGALVLGGCAYDDGYGYGGVSVGSGYYGGGYYDPYYSPGYYGGGQYGWYNNYYYPGTGYYVYDRGGKRHRWTNSQRSYWEARRADRRDDRGRDRDGRRNWRGNDGRPDRDGRPGNWQRPDRDGRPGNYARPDRNGRPDGGNDRGRWQGGRGRDGNDAVRRPPQPRPQASQPRPQRSIGNRTAPASRASRPSRSGREPSPRTRPN
jgi:hypothetical protein